MNWLKKHFHVYMIRPIVIKTITRAMAALVIALLWDRFVNVERIGQSRLSDGMMIIGIVLVVSCWFQYLQLDGIRVFHNAGSIFRPSSKKKKAKRSQGGDIADYVDEETVSFEELEEEEKIICRMMASLLAGILLIVASALIM